MQASTHIHSIPYTAPLSPPRSPYMSAESMRHKDGSWQYAVNGTSTTANTGQHIAYDYSMHPNAAPHNQRPQLRTAQSYQYSPSYPGQAQDGYITASDTRSSTFAGSAPASPTSRLTPRSPLAERSSGFEEEDDLSGGEGGEDEEGDEPLTAEQRLQQKRKMKRFRLTHNQTRYLMSEFARQAHPDAAHRERLSREIPGLSPRQVQVWFQNRRAKLKRLTADDRERMVRSRQLPDHFDMAPGSLNPTYGGHGAAAAPILPTPGTYGSYGSNAGVRPLTLDTLRRLPDYEYTQQPQQHQYGGGHSGLTPAMSSYSFTPPQSGTNTTSPLSAPTSSMTPAYPFQPQDSPRRSSASVGFNSIGTVTGVNRAPTDPGLRLPRASLPYDSTQSQERGSYSNVQLPSYAGVDRTQPGMSHHPSHSKPTEAYRRDFPPPHTGAHTAYGSYAPAAHLPNPNVSQYGGTFGDPYGSQSYQASYSQHTSGP